MAGVTHWAPTARSLRIYTGAELVAEYHADRLPHAIFLAVLAWEQSRNLEIRPAGIVRRRQLPAFIMDAARVLRDAHGNQ